MRCSELFRWQSHATSRPATLSHFLFHNSMMHMDSKQIWCRFAGLPRTGKWQRNRGQRISACCTRYCSRCASLQEQQASWRSITRKRFLGAEKVCDCTVFGPSRCRFHSFELFSNTHWKSRTSQRQLRGSGAACCWRLSHQVNAKKVCCSQIQYEV